MRPPSSLASLFGVTPVGSVTNEGGQTGSGRTDGRWHLTSNWSGTQVNGTISRDGDTIYWDNGTSWTR